jgi:hypothetical protein
VLQWFQGHYCTFYARFITATPAADRAAVNAYLLSPKAAVTDIATAISNAQLAFARARKQSAVKAPVAPTAQTEGARTPPPPALPTQPVEPDAGTPPTRAAGLDAQRRIPPGSIQSGSEID